MKPCMLIILDGWGYKPGADFNAVEASCPACFYQLWREYPHTTLIASGLEVGLPAGIMGNSEVGHLNLGAGRIVYQDLLRIDRAIEDGSFFENVVLKSAMQKIKAGHALHLIGLVSDGGVHSHFMHLQTLVDMAKKLGVPETKIHAVLDGRDTPPKSGVRYIQKLQDYLKNCNYGNIATVCGRYYAMDRDNRWERVEQAYNLYTCGIGARQDNAVQSIINAYERNETDEFIKPMALEGFNGMQDDDVVIFFNFRADRAREITRALTEKKFDGFDRQKIVNLAEYVTFTLYDEKLNQPIAFGPEKMHDGLGEVISKHGINQLRISETEKYAHVTYFFNGGEEAPFVNEDRCLIPSPRDVATYDQKPEMSARVVADEVVKRLDSGKYQFAVLNFANPDMVGHTGIMEAATAACIVTDECLCKVVNKLKEKGWAAVVTSDHGNAEEMKDAQGQPQTAHTTNATPCILVDDDLKGHTLKIGKLADIAPTILEIMDLPKPVGMTGESLLK